VKSAILAMSLSMLLSNSARAANPIVVMETSLGTIKLELFEDKAPGTVKNFLSYVDDKHYDGTIFHRVIGTFMIQGGGFSADKKEKASKPPIKNEASNGISNARGTIAMARETAPDTATCEFYINVVDNPRLDRANAKDGFGYCVFGKVVEGMDVVDKIKGVRTAEGTLERKSGADRSNTVPVEDVLIKSVKRVEK
jgi:cyclophilin family peptidyl-prolyl cis-trans isomerase